MLSAFPPLSTDMYLPAIPFLQKQWGVSLVKMNLTLICFFVTYCFFLLIYGPVSDRFGRRGPLMAGIGVFILASIGCALAVGVDYLIAYRVLQAAGAASSSTLALAISKDVFEGHMREKVLAYVAVIMAVAPMTAPIFGGWIITAWSWRCVFVAQALLGAVSLAGVYLMPESLRDRVKTSPLQMVASYARLAANPRYASLVLGVSILGFLFSLSSRARPTSISTVLGSASRSSDIFSGSTPQASCWAPWPLIGCEASFPPTLWSRPDFPAYSSAGYGCTWAAERPRGTWPSPISSWP